MAVLQPSVTALSVVVVVVVAADCCRVALARESLAMAHNSDRFFVRGQLSNRDCPMNAKRSNCTDVVVSGV
jgi:hypothetical protein